ncbi:MAG TPA: permease [Methylomirabilota bacterium]|nr:permease [Methylomirabilota bacterium]
MTRRVDASTWILLGLVVAAVAVALARDASLPLRAVSASSRLLRGVWLDLALGFLLAGLIEVLIPPQTMTRWLGGERMGQGILIGWAAGLALPGGPYFFFPVAANLLKHGAAAGPLITLLTAKTLVSPIRMLTYEAPLLGWPLTLARCIPGLLLPPLLGLLGQWLFNLFKR